MAELLGDAEIRRIMDVHGLEARRSLGQNFVVEPAVVSGIAALAGVGPDQPAIEIGPGLGSLTLALAAQGAEVIAVEKDEQLAAVLVDLLETRAISSVEVVNDDALSCDWRALVDPARKYVLVSNLPYNVAVPVIMRLLAEAPMVARMIVMVQQEVAERLVASSGGRTIGIPSIALAWFANAEIVETIPPEVFTPRPRVMSSVLAIDRHPAPSSLITREQMMDLVVSAYRQRRKMLRSTLAPQVTTAQFERAGVDPKSRPEELEIEDWVRLCEAVIELPAPAVESDDSGRSHSLD